MNLQNENEFMYFICSHISYPLKNLKMTYVSQKLYKDMFDLIIYYYLDNEQITIDYDVHKYETTRKKAIYLEVFKLKDKNPNIYQKIMDKLKNLFEYFDLHDKYFDYYIQLYYRKFSSYTRKYIDYDNSCLKQTFFDTHIDEKKEVIYFLRNNILLFLDYCFNTDKYDYISILIYDLYNIGFDIDLKMQPIEINKIYNQMNTIFYDLHFHMIFYQYENEQIKGFIHDLFWLNSQLFMDKTFYDEKIKIYQIAKLKELKQSKNYKLCKSNKQRKKLLDKLKDTHICPCCVHKYIKFD
jgi:hypothetical protein